MVDFERVAMKVLFDLPLWLLAGVGLPKVLEFFLPASSSRDRGFAALAVICIYVFVRAMVTMPLVGN